MTKPTCACSLPHRICLRHFAVLSPAKQARWMRQLGIVRAAWLDRRPGQRS